VDVLLQLVGPNTFDVTPVLDVLGGGAKEIPLEIDVFVNGVLVARDRMHEIEPFSSCFGRDKCEGECEIIILGDGIEKGSQAGRCVSVRFPLPLCFCFAEEVTSWPIVSMSIPPRAEVEIVVDPRDIVEEFDETNNRLFITAPSAVGGITEFFIDGAAHPAGVTSGCGSTTAWSAGIAAAIVVGLVASGGYARRRSLGKRSKTSEIP